jgi:hypothetical protein
MLFHASKVLLTKWFWAIYWVSSDKGSVLALRLTKALGNSWHTANKMLRKLRMVTNWDWLHCLLGVSELDDALVGNKEAKAQRVNPLSWPLVSIMSGNQFVALKAIASINHETVNQLAKTHLELGQIVHTDALHVLIILAEKHHYVTKVTLLEETSEWLPWIHMAISNFKTFVFGTYHGISGKYLQET